LEEIQGDNDIMTDSAWEKERSDVIKTLRSVCKSFGDNDWLDDLHLADVIEKHLARHLWLLHWDNANKGEMMNDDMELQVTVEDIKWTRKSIADYDAKAADYEIKAADCRPSQRGAYLSNAAQAIANRDLMAGNLAFQLAWLKENQPEVYEEVMK
jgi:hypothetical protein